MNESFDSFMKDQQESLSLIKDGVLIHKDVKPTLGKSEPRDRSLNNSLKGEHLFNILEMYQSYTLEHRWLEQLKNTFLNEGLLMVALESNKAAKSKHEGQALLVRFSIGR